MLILILKITLLFHRFYQTDQRHHRNQTRLQMTVTEFRLRVCTQTIALTQVRVVKCSCRFLDEGVT